MRECVVDTMVLRKANAVIQSTPTQTRDFAKRILLLQNLRTGEFRLLFSKKLLSEYRSQVLEPRNDYVKAIFDLMTLVPGNARHNWAPRKQIVQTMQDCRFPAEDEHLLRTAALDDDISVLFTEEGRIMQCDIAKLKRCLGVAVENPVK